MHHIPTAAPVLVTGGNGYIAAHVVEMLLEKNYKVRATVRDASKPDKYKHLLQMKNAQTNLELVSFDLTADEMDLKLLDNVEVVLHVASPFIVNVKDPQKDLVDPAVKGTLNVLSACLKSNVKQVILTSSVAAISDSPKLRQITEDDWNDDCSLTKNSYNYSKVSAEKAAWKFMKDQVKGKFKLVTICPSLVFGPCHTDSVNTAVNVLQELLKPVFLDLSVSFVDVRDVAQAHIAAFENEKSEGYFCIY
jgi:dihydroflavonol-4-reductase